MPSQIQNSAGGTSFADVLDVILARLRVVFTQTGFVRSVAAPEASLQQYIAQDGIMVRVRPPRPTPKYGAGRYAQKAKRLVDVVILTQSLLDAAGDDYNAVKAHLTREEGVINVLSLVPPVGSGYDLRVGIQIEWVEGGDDITRQIKVDPGMLVSALLFDVEYVCPTKVYRD